MNKERTKKKECYFFQGLQEGLQRSNTGVFRRVLCEGYNYTPNTFKGHTAALYSVYGRVKRQYPIIYKISPDIYKLSPKIKNLSDKI